MDKPRLPPSYYSYDIAIIVILHVLSILVNDGRLKRTTTRGTMVL